MEAEEPDNCDTVITFGERLTARSYYESAGQARHCPAPTMRAPCDTAYRADQTKRTTGRRPMQ